MSLRMLIVLLGLGGGLAFVAPSRADEPKQTGGDDRAALERRLADVEKQLDLLRKELETTRKEPRPKPGPGTKADMRVYPIKYLAATELAHTLHEALSERTRAVRIVADPQTNSLLIAAPDEETATVLALIEKLDVPVAVDVGVKATIRVYPLQELEAAATVKVLRDIFPVTQHKTLRLSVSDQTNIVVAAGPDSDLAAVESLIVRLESVAKDRKGSKTSERR